MWFILPNEIKFKLLLNLVKFPHRELVVISSISKFSCEFTSRFTSSNETVFLFSPRDFYPAAWRLHRFQSSGRGATG